MRNVSNKDSESVKPKNEDELAVKWTDLSENRLVLFADIMGFKNFIATNNDEVVCKTMVEFSNGVEKKSKPLVGPKMRMMRFSDSLILITKGATADDLNKLTKAAARLMQYGLKMKLPIKGAIAMGPIYLDEEKQLMFGKALVDAYLIEEELFYYGIAVHHSAESLVVENKNKHPYHLLDLPMKSGKIPHYQLTWHYLSFELEPKDITDQVTKNLDKVQAEVSGRPRIYISNTREIIKKVNDNFPFQGVREGEDKADDK